MAAEFSPFVFLPLSTRAYFKGRAYIKIILKNHARSYFAGRSYYRGNTVLVRQQGLIKTDCSAKWWLLSHLKNYIMVSLFCQFVLPFSYLYLW